MANHITEKTGCKPYSGEGISYRKAQKTCILRSVDDTPYYDDDLSDPDYPKYTLAGKNGNQDLTDKRNNPPLIDTSKTKHIFLYRVSNTPKKQTSLSMVW